VGAGREAEFTTAARVDTWQYRTLVAIRDELAEADPVLLTQSVYELALTASTSAVSSATCCALRLW
jgi:hypothetical protein